MSPLSIASEGIPTYINQPITKGRCQSIGGHVSYPTHSPYAIRLGLRSSLSLALPQQKFFWRIFVMFHGMMTSWHGHISLLLALYAGSNWLPVDSQHKVPVMQCLDGFFVVSLANVLNNSQLAGEMTKYQLIKARRDAFMRQLINHHWFRYWLVAWSASGHHLNQWWDIVNSNPRNKFLWNLKQKSYIFFQEKTF